MTISVCWSVGGLVGRSVIISDRKLHFHAPIGALVKSCFNYSENHLSTGDNKLLCHCRDFWKLCFIRLEEMEPTLLELQEKYGANVCGEGGEFETYTLDSPLFRKVC